MKRPQDVESQKSGEQRRALGRVPGRVWIVEDSTLHRQQAEAVLSSSYAVEGFANGEEVLERLSAQSLPDVVLLDWQLPGISGLDVCRVLRDLFDDVTLPILMLTVRGHRTDFVEGLGAGANDYVAKPWDDAELLARVNNLTRVGQQARLLVRERARLSAILSTLEEGITLHDASGAMLFSNEAARRLVSADALTTTPLSTIKEDGTPLPAHEHPALRALGTGEPVRGEVLGVRRDDGSLSWLSFNARPFFDAVGAEPAGVVSSFLDVSPSKMAHEELRRSEAEFRTLAEALPEVAWVSDPDGQFTYVNQALVRMSGLCVDELLRLDTTALIHPDDLPAARATWQRSLATGTAYASEHRVRTRDGTHRWHRVRSVPVQSSSGAVTRWLGVCTDVEDLVQAQAAMAERNQLEQQLIGIVSHDLRNPLNAIHIGASALATREDLPADLARFVLRIQSSTDRAIGLVKDLLDFTQARLGGGLEILPRPMDLLLHVQRVLSEIEATWPGRTVAVTHEGDLRLNGDPDRLEQAVQNLLSNALKYSPADSTVDVHLRGDPLRGDPPRGDDEVVLSVHNRGTPIPSNQLTRIFEPMQRAATVLDKQGRSVGLGLYIVKHIVERHGGSVDVVSDVDAGTTFTVRLPRNPAARGAGTA